MANVAIIPLRGGSKGIKNKNIVELHGKPLLFYTLKSCFDCDEIDYVAITTDSEEIANVAQKLYPDVLIVQRPNKLASDTATSEDALTHAILELDRLINNIENILFVQATSPLSTSTDFASLLRLLSCYDSGMFYTEDYGHFVEIHNLKKARLPRQKRTPLKREAGNAWSFKKEGFLKEKVRTFGNIGLIKMDFLRTYEIDEIEDLYLVEALMLSGRV
jgi:N-acylneuraminate cytidylyltransferase